jgi:hypothetical protein
MDGEERKRRTIAAQGFAALALFLFAHGAHAATPPAHHAPTVGHHAVATQRAA